MTHLKIYTLRETALAVWADLEVCEKMIADRKERNTYIWAFACVRSAMGVEVVLLSKHLGAPGDVTAKALTLRLPTISRYLLNNS